MESVFCVRFLRRIECYTKEISYSLTCDFILPHNYILQNGYVNAHCKIKIPLHRNPVNYSFQINFQVKANSIPESADGKFHWDFMGLGEMSIILKRICVIFFPILWNKCQYVKIISYILWKALKRGLRRRVNNTGREGAEPVKQMD